MKKIKCNHWWVENNYEYSMYICLSCGEIRKVDKKGRLEVYNNKKEIWENLKK